MSRSPKDYLLHILDETSYLLAASDNLAKEEFYSNETLKRSFVRSLEVIGEATKNLPEDFTAKYPQIPWRRITGIILELITM